MALDDAQLVTLRLESGKYVRFQPDTGALTKAIPINMKITAYGGHALPVGSVLLRVWRGNFRCKLDCKLVDSSQIRPLLGRKACLGMNIVSYLDNDKIHQIQFGEQFMLLRTVKWTPLSS